VNWICCQIGAREHYAVARALRRHHTLERLLTDAWFFPTHPLGKLKRCFRERFHHELSDAKISAFNLEAVGFELRARLSGLSGWPLMAARNNWFQRCAVSRLASLQQGEGRCVIFAFSYAARDIFRFARSRGWQTVLGQIDAGPSEERIIDGLHGKDSVPRREWERAPRTYWDAWREECTLADRVVVNSSWSKYALEEEGIPASKIRTVPLAYEGPKEAAEFHRKYPPAFTMSRPLRVLFLGSICARKGIFPLFEAIRALQGEAVEFWFVGPRQVPIPLDLQDSPKIQWFGVVRRSGVSRFYREADVFVFPTFSDGFGLTQLEAQAWQLPIIATRFCGDVITHGHNGWLLEEVTGIEIARTIRNCLARPRQLQEFANNTIERERCGLTQIGAQWLQVLD
jgi:glycosyltransferase involved in cell wall biosynthesis